MLRLLLGLTLFISLTTEALAQSSFVARRNDNGATIQILTNGQLGSLAADQYGQLLVGAITPGTGATNLGKEEDALSVSGDTGVMSLGVRNTGFTVLTGGALDYSPISVNSQGAPFIDVNRNAQFSATDGLLKAEDGAAASGDALVGVAGKIESSSTPIAPAADEDYTTLMLGQYGQSVSTLIHDLNYGVNFTLSTLEDNSLATDGAAGLKVFAQTQDPLTSDQSGTNDAAYLKVDRAGRLITTLAPAGETFSNCSTDVTTSGNFQVKAAVASNRIYVTSVNCGNNSAVSARIVLSDGSGGTTLAAFGVGTQAATGGAFAATFPVPLRLTSNTALFMNVGTTATSTICCASGYISTI